MTVNVRSVNDAPTAVDSSVTTNEDTDKTFAGADFSFTDAADNPANGLAAVIVTSLPTNGSALYSGAALVVTELPTSVRPADLAAGKLVFRPAANANGSPYATFGFKVQDNGGTSYGRSEEHTAKLHSRVDVLCGHDPPNTVDSSVTTNEDTDKTFAGA